MAQTTFDYVIIGGGTAGCVLANRLSEDGRSSVLLIEGGHKGEGFLNRVPASSFMLIGNPRFDWIFPVAPDPTINDQVKTWSGGKLLGGSSSINGMVYLRGLKSDFDDWAGDGAEGWDWAALHPYFLKSENYTGPDLPSHARGGPLTVSPSTEVHPLAHAFIRSCGALGMSKLDDYCAGEMFGSFLNLSTTRNGVRVSARTAYLAPVRRRRNLTVRTGVLVDRILMDGTRARGVETCGPNGRERVSAGREIILSAGTLASPPILMRSGIGPADHLRPYGIDVVADLPGVGANLQEHTALAVCHEVDVPTYNNMTGPVSLASAGLRWLLTGKGPLASIAVHAMAYGRSSLSDGRADIIFSFIPIAVDHGPKGITPHKRSGVTIGSNVARPHSRGVIHLETRDPYTRPNIAHPLFDDERDIVAAIDAVKMSEAMFRAPGLRDHFNGRINPPSLPLNEDEWVAYLRETASSGYHPVGTCRIGSDDRSVVNERLQVRGIRGLRVVDASVMPRLVSGNTQAATYAVAERGADLIREDRDAL
ncbi:choline dehydrogenase [Novosphingobium endophyticum]|uniref:Choline dehydrogenase n=1 Tax=Novosphingobium endophyticum TaxID=1955250 RepID=A0A916X5U8_9SPHN|nr:GMC family oxidoreductase N-terminal domain-containing protein [Novosphingobium endophyticum]GGC00507.1 choline dehydrogenase [Novosphingobium endophyticum]